MGRNEKMKEALGKVTTIVELREACKHIDVALAHGLVWEYNAALKRCLGVKNAASSS